MAHALAIGLRRLQGAAWVGEAMSEGADEYVRGLANAREVYEDRIRTLEAQCAAMREALLTEVNDIRSGHNMIEDELHEKGTCGICDGVHEAESALATDAGKAMLEENRRQSELYDKLITDRDAERRLLTERAEAAERDAKEGCLLCAADMRERCAKVAESYEPECESCPRGCASAIRALPLEEP